MSENTNEQKKGTVEGIDLERMVSPQTPTVKEIMKHFLIGNKFDGLYSDDCGCSIDDLMVCDENVIHCCPGYKHPCDCPDEHLYHIGAKQGL